MAVTFAYDLGLRRFLYQNRPIRRDEVNPSRHFSHRRPSWGRNKPNSVLHILRTQLSALEMSSDGYGPNIKVSPFDDTELSYFDHFSI